MELAFYSPKTADAIPAVKWNFEELKAQLNEGLKKYENVVVTSDTVPVAKHMRADLNRLSKAINDERIAMKKRYLAPYEDFEKQAKELTGLIDAQSAKIDAQVKEFEQREKDDKQAEIKAIYEEVIGDFKDLIPYERLHDPKWLNKGVSLKAVRAAMEDTIARTGTAFTVINQMGFDEPTTNRVKAAFLRRFDLSDAIAEKEKIQDENRRLAEYELKKKAEERAKAEAESQAAEKAPQRAEETVNEPEKVVEPPQKEKPAEKATALSEAETVKQIDFRVWATKQQLDSLKQFLIVSGIKYGRVE